MNNKIKNTIKFIFVLAVLYFVYHQVNQNWDELIRFDWIFNPAWFVLSIVAQLVTFVMFAKVWCILVFGFGYKVPLRYGFKIAYIANLGRYIPGKIWQVFGMVYYAKKVNIPEEVAVTSWIVSMTFALPAAFLVSAVGIVFFPYMLFSELNSTYQLAIIAIALGTFLLSALLVTFPAKSFMILNFALKKIGRPSLNFNLSRGLALKVYAGYFASWVMYGFSFWFFLHAIIPDPKIGIIEGATAFVLSYQLGYVAFLAPGGVGVRELVLAGVLAPFIGPIASGVAIAGRFWNLIIEISAAFIALGIKIKDRDEK